MRELGNHQHQEMLSRLHLDQQNIMEPAIRFNDQLSEDGHAASEYQDRVDNQELTSTNKEES